jgi:hypothetical protein
MPDDICEWLAGFAGVKGRGTDTLEDVARSCARLGRPLALLIDDAHVMPEEVARALDETLARVGDPLVLVLAFLDGAAAAPVLSLFSGAFERVFLGTAISTEDVEDAVRARLGGEGRSIEGQEITAKARDLFARTNGVARLVDAEIDQLIWGSEEGPQPQPDRAPDPLPRLSRLIGASGLETKLPPWIPPPRTRRPRDRAPADSEETAGRPAAAPELRTPDAAEVPARPDEDRLVLDEPAPACTDFILVGAPEPTGTMDARAVARHVRAMRAKENARPIPSAALPRSSVEIMLLAASLSSPLGDAEPALAEETAPTLVEPAPACTDFILVGAPEPMGSMDARAVARHVRATRANARPIPCVVPPRSSVEVMLLAATLAPPFEAMEVAPPEEIATIPVDAGPTELVAEGAAQSADDAGALLAELASTPWSSEVAAPSAPASLDAVPTRSTARKTWRVRPLPVLRVAAALCLIAVGFLLGRWREGVRTEPPLAAVEAAPPTTVAAEGVSPAAVPDVQPILVHVNARPWAHIAIDGRDQGDTPLGNVPLSPGLHRFRAELPGGRVVDREVMIDAQTRHVSFP